MFRHQKFIWCAERKFPPKSNSNTPYELMPQILSRPLKNFFGFSLRTALPFLTTNPLLFKTTELPDVATHSRLSRFRKTPQTTGSCRSIDHLTFFVPGSMLSKTPL